METTKKAPTFDGTQPCRQYKVEMFFPVDKVEEAKMRAFFKPICGSCNFQSACLDWALENREVGIWAGTTSDERRLIIRRLRRK